MRCSNEIDSSGDSHAMGGAIAPSCGLNVLRFLIFFSGTAAAGVAIASR